MIVTYAMTCRACGLVNKEAVEIGLMEPQYFPFKEARNYGHEMCNGCIGRMHRLVRAISERKLTDQEFDAALETLKRQIKEGTTET